MAEIVGAAASVISVLLNLSEDLYNEVKLREGVKGDIKKLKDELRHMKACLLDVDELEMGNAFQEWVSDLRRLANDAENFIETLSLTSGPETRAGSWWRCIPCCSSSTPSPINRTLRSQLENLIAEAKNVGSLRERYANVPTASDRRKSLENLKKKRVESSYAPRTHDHMVGLKDTIDSLEGKLTSGGSDHPFVMSILGMGGLGKTTLARRLYNKLSGTGHFQKCAWICVTQEYEPEDLLEQLIRMIINPKKEELENLIKTHSMEKYLYDRLEGRCFLVVIDDVWDIEAWERIHGAFPQNNINSRIIITTRNKDVAQIDGGAYVHVLRGLDEEESWELFCRKSFSKCNVMTKCPAHLETVGKEMVKKCDGLPLALITLGGLLSRKSPEFSEWEAVSNNLWGELKNVDRSIDAVLALSYKDLHLNLKHCFLYIGMFPEDSLIPISKLMLLWEAEGFNREEGGRLEDTSKYFKELVDRSLLQAEVGHSWIPRKSTCRIHDLLRDLANRKAKEIAFSAFYYARQRFSLVNETCPSIRLAISYPHPSTIPHDYTNDRLRTFRLMTEVYKVGQSSVSSYISVDELLQSIDGRFNMLRVLDIEVPEVVTITNLQLGGIIHLRYLGIDCSAGGWVELPENIGNLKSLQTISINSMELTLPDTMGKLKKLKHMIGGNRSMWIGNLTWIGKLTCLETLFIQGKKWSEIDDTTSLVNLRRLTICSDSVVTSDSFDIDTSKFCSNLQSLTRLHTIDLDGYDCGSISYFEVFRHCPSIRHFRGKINSKSCDFHDFAKNLEVLEVSVYDSSILLPSIQELPKLRALKIDINPIYKTSRLPMLVMDCSRDGFAQLQTLHIAFYPLYRGDNNPAEMELKVADGGLPLLTNFHVNFPEILIAPDRLKQRITVAP